MKLFLISNSGHPLYDWCKEDIADFVGRKVATFISAATSYDLNEYFERAKSVLEPLGIKLIHLDLSKKPELLVDRAEAFLVGGGNTHLLLSRLNNLKLISRIKSRVENGTLYVGLSAGANIAGPNILTTNDWNILGSTTFEGLGLVPFNINPHYVDPHEKKIFSGENRDERILEYLEFNDNPVVALEEQTYLEVSESQVRVGGQGKVKVFVKGKEPKEFQSGKSIAF